MEGKDIVEIVRKLVREEVSKTPGGTVSFIVLVVSKSWMSLEILVPQREKSNCL